MHQALKKYIRLAALILVVRIFLITFGLREFPRFVDLYHIDSLIVVDSIIAFIMHPITFVVMICIINIILVINIVKTTDAIRKKYVSLFSWSLSLSIFYSLIPTLIGMLKDGFN
ncbi:hypothetical protein ABE82_25995 (plasmid) [Paenibacillus peoriae]|nr:hypothetical protein ABE82_25995 [Paenibacillus peoriae]